MSHGEEGPKFMFSDKALEKLCHPWSNAMIVKLLNEMLNEKDDNSRITGKQTMKEVI